VVELTENYRSSPEILGLANRLIASTGRTKDLLATRPSGPAPSRVAYADPAAELAGLVGAIRARIDEGIAPTEIAVLVRMNAQLEPIESALTAAAIPYVVRGGGFYERPDVRAAVREIQRAKPAAVGRDLPAAIRVVFTSAFGYDPDASPRGPEERERAADLAVLLAIADAFSRPDAGRSEPAGAPEFLAELARRDAAERANSAGGVTLSTIHRAKGLEWDAVFLPGLEEGNLPIGQAAGDPAAIDEERRLLYVGITRARVRLAVSWAERRAGPNGREGSRRPSRFIGDLGLLPARTPARPIDDPRFEALRTWRAERAKDDGVPAYVIAHDTTLADIAQARPGSIAELRRVKGMGPARLQRYGPEILAVLARI
jgi:DNA helicase-2/ATP-dependent DNA helicase PcrA